MMLTRNPYLYGPQTGLLAPAAGQFDTGNDNPGGRSMPFSNTEGIVREQNHARVLQEYLLNEFDERRLLRGLNRMQGDQDNRFNPLRPKL